MSTAIMAIGLFVALTYAPRVVSAVLGKDEANMVIIMLHALGWVAVFVGSTL